VSGNNLNEYFHVELIDLVNENRHLKGIYTPKKDLGASKIGVTDQFLANAETYSENYFYPDHFDACLKKAFIVAEFNISDPIILDIGSGSGNTVIPLMKRFPNSRIIATDISEQLLFILKKNLKMTDNSENQSIDTICMDVTKSGYIKNDSFDLVVGASILHHLIDPYKCLEEAFRAIKEGGFAIFFEPFENGYSILRLAYTEILERSSPVVLSKYYINDVYKDFLRRMILDYKVRSDPDKSNNLFMSLDDKWLFTHEFFNIAKSRFGFKEIILYSLYPLNGIFRMVTEDNMKKVVGKKSSNFPIWAWSIIEKYDNAFSPSFKKDLILDGAIIFKK